MKSEKRFRRSGPITGLSAWFIFAVGSFSNAQVLVEYDHTAGSPNPSSTAAGVTSSVSFGGSLTGTAPTTIDQFSAANNSGNLPNNNIGAGDFRWFFNYSVQGLNATYESLTFDALAKDPDRRYQASYIIGTGAEQFITGGQTAPRVHTAATVNQPLLDTIDFADFTTSDTVSFRFYWQGGPTANSGSRVYIDDFILNGFLVSIPAAPGATEPSKPRFVDIVDVGAISQLSASAIPMNLAIGQAASNVHNVGGRSLNHRLNRLRIRLSGDRTAPQPSPRMNLSGSSISATQFVSKHSGGDASDSPSSKAPVFNDSPVSYSAPVKNPVDPDAIASGENWMVFASGDFGFYDIDPLEGTTGLDSDTYTSTAGIEYILTDHLAVGAGWSHVWSDNSLRSGLGGFDIEGNAAMTYLSFFKNNLWGDLFYSYGDYNVDIHRNTLLGSNVRANPDLESHQTTLNLGYNIPSGNRVVHGPTFRADHSWGQLDGYTETGDLRANTIFREQDYRSLVTALGWQINWESEMANGTRLKPNFWAGYGRENLNQEANVSGTLEQSPFSRVNLETGQVVGRGNSLTQTLSQVDPGEGWMEIGAGLGVDFTNRFGIYADYQGRFFQDNAQLHLGTVKASWKW